MSSEQGQLLLEDEPKKHDRPSVRGTSTYEPISHIFAWPIPTHRQILNTACKVIQQFVYNISLETNHKTSYILRLWKLQSPHVLLWISNSAGHHCIHRQTMERNDKESWLLLEFNSVESPSEIKDNVILFIGMYTIVVCSLLALLSRF